MMLWLLMSCGADLIPGERVLGDEVAAVIVDGAAGSSFGQSVAVGTDGTGALRVLVGAPDAGEIVLLDSDGTEIWAVEGDAGFGSKVGWWGTVPWAWTPGVGVQRLDDEEVGAWVAPNGTSVDICEDGSLVQTEAKGEAVACSAQHWVRTVCDGPACTVVLDSDEGRRDLGETTSGSAVGWWQDTACWGDASIGQATAAGAVHCEDGTTVSGLDGDHLGLALGGGRVAGLFNRHLQPPRARILPQAGGDVWVVDRAAERSRIALSGSDTLLAVGVPGFGGTEAREGRVYLIGPQK